MLAMKKAELVFIPSPGLSHLVPTVEVAKLLLHRDNRISVTVLILKIRKDADAAVDDYTQKTSSNPCLRFIHLPSSDDTSKSQAVFFELIENQITQVRDTVSNLIRDQSDSKIAALILDTFCTKFIQVSDEFRIPSYVFFTSAACGLGCCQYVLSLKHEQNLDLTQYKNSDLELNIPCFSKHVPASVLPAVFVGGTAMADLFLNCLRRVTEAKGIMVNTFYELESYAIDALSSDGKMPKLYPVGPILNSSGGGRLSDDDDVKIWLDDFSPLLTGIFPPT